MKKETNLSKLDSKQRCSYISKNWAIIKSGVESILRNNSNLTESEVISQLPISFDKKLVLGQGMWGVVLKLKNEKIVVKLTSDLLELSLVDLIMDSDESISNHKGIPHIAGLEIFPDLNGIIVRENLKTGGVLLNASSPITRAVNTIINDFVVPLSSDEIELNDILKGMNKGTLRDLSFSHSIIKGNSIKYAKKAYAKIKEPSKESKSYHVVRFIKKILKVEGVGLIDLHSDNLAFPKYDIEDVFGIKRSKDDFKKFVISDLGLAYDTPVMALDSPDLYYEDNQGNKNLSKVLERLIELYYQPYEELTYFDADDHTLKSKDIISYYIMKNRDRVNPYEPKPSQKMFSHIELVAFNYISKGLNFAYDERFNEYVYRIIQDINSISGNSLDQDRVFNSIMQRFISTLSRSINNTISISSTDDSIIPFYSESSSIRHMFSRQTSSLSVSFDFDLLQLCFNKSVFFTNLESDRFIVFVKIKKDSDHIERILSTLDLYEGDNISFDMFIDTESIVSINGINKLEIENGI